MEEDICSRFCSFYKPESQQAEHRCGSFTFLSRNLTRGELATIASRASASYDFSLDSTIRDEVCARCEYLQDGCDFRAGAGKTPCGGYAVLEYLYKKSH